MTDPFRITVQPGGWVDLRPALAAAFDVFSRYLENTRVGHAADMTASDLMQGSPAAPPPGGQSPAAPREAEIAGATIAAIDNSPDRARAEKAERELAEAKTKLRDAYAAIRGAENIMPEIGNFKVWRDSHTATRALAWAFRETFR